MSQKYISATDNSSVIPTSVDVIIIGAGPAGAAAAWALDRAQPGLRTLVIERASTPGAGSSRASLENFRTCWPCAPLARMMQRSVEVFMRADEYLGEGAFAALHPKQQGYLWCAFTDRSAATLRADVEHLRGMGIDTIHYLTGDEVAYRFPWLGPQVVAAKYDPTAGWLDSNAMISRFLAHASGAQVLLDVGDVRLCIEGNRVRGVEVGMHTVDAPLVLLAAGAWSVLIAREAGLSLPVVIRPRQSVTTGWRHESFPDHAPMLIGGAPFPHVRPEARSGAIFGWEYRWHRKHASGMHPTEEAHIEHDDALPGPVGTLELLKDARFPSVTLALLARQFGHSPGEGFADPRYLRSVYHNIGYYVYRGVEAAYRVDEDGTRIPYESERAILDRHPDIEGLYLSLAHVGHGVMSAPCGGEIIARQMLGQPPIDGLDEAFRLATTWVPFDENAL